MSAERRIAVVTGCAGFIGSHLVESLLRDRWVVHGIDAFDDYYDPAIKVDNVRSYLHDPNFNLQTFDLSDAQKVTAFARRSSPDVVVHLAAVAGVRLSTTDPARYVRANVVSTQNVLDAWSRMKKVPLVFASSSSVYGDTRELPFDEAKPCGRPRSPYAATKRACELLCEAAHAIDGVPITVLRLFTVYGPRQRPDLAIHKFGAAMLRGEPIEVFGDGTMARDFTHVSDVVRGIRAAMSEASGLRTVNLGNSSPISVIELVEKLARALGVRPRLNYVPRPPGEMDVTFADVRRASELWSWKPIVSIDDGLAEFAQWIAERHRSEKGGDPHRIRE